ncbi:MAG: hypothetical protein LBM27_00785, partial [Lactobacillaceae bacterium]|nr:hypothetical protein [Lactobacillaceae bacterium]
MSDNDNDFYEAEKVRALESNAAAVREQAQATRELANQTQRAAYEQKRIQLVTEYFRTDDPKTRQKIVNLLSKNINQIDFLDFLDDQYLNEDDVSVRSRMISLLKPVLVSSFS